ncbi:predicted protein [Sclerotinia sclerotiorum 1980 UF-70]|uniref:Uncharacterized protein n=1 Tax=Sclerotinia sclerotiorum (strain ATCC 18683 / 1980 / Ss-1) TaxID=665079 RepID=A7F1V2_SCLS1|nr:predicted protein [Sclerotinia sclerotiorum 1980 UF-70]EDN95694.1 predicted protein [Sclerotinia sclerotiorum 1980 UF-70]
MARERINVTHLSTINHMLTTIFQVKKANLDVVVNDKEAHCRNGLSTLDSRVSSRALIIL